MYGMLNCYIKISRTFFSNKKKGKLHLTAFIQAVEAALVLSKDCPLHVEKHVKTSEWRFWAISLNSGDFDGILEVFPY